MTTNDDFDGRLASWLTTIAPSAEPGGLADRVLEQTARTRRRPAWRIPERWIPMATITTQATSVARPPWRTVALLAVMSLLAFAGLPARETDGVSLLHVGGDRPAISPGTDMGALTKLAVRMPPWKLDRSYFSFGECAR